MSDSILITDRLILREWRNEDHEPFARMNADPRVMEFMPALLSPEESNRFVQRIATHFREHGFGLYAVQLKSEPTFLGFTGLSVPSFQAAFTPCVEIGWRLAAEAWGKGYATEAARAVVDHAFEKLGLEDLVSFTVPANLRSRRVMEKLGMRHDVADDFDHPLIPAGDRLRRHVLYRLKATNV